MAHERHQVLGRMNFESPYVDMPHRLTVRQNLRVFARLYGVTDIEEKIARLAEDLALVEFLDRASGSLSAGQKTRVALAKALINAVAGDAWLAPASLIQRRIAMAKGQQRGNREAKKPKKEKPKPAATAQTSFVLNPQKSTGRKDDRGKKK